MDLANDRTREVCSFGIDSQHSDMRMGRQKSDKIVAVKSVHVRDAFDFIVVAVGQDRIPSRYDQNLMNSIELWHKAREPVRLHLSILRK